MKFGSTCTYLPKHLLIGTTSDAPPCIFHLDSREPTTDVDNFNVVHYKPNLEKGEQMKTHSKVAAQDAEQEQTNWRRIINIYSRYDAMRQKYYLHFLNPHTCGWTSGNN